MKVCIYIFAIIGFVLMTGFLFMKLGFTKTRGLIDIQHDYFQKQIENPIWIQSQEWLVLKQAILKDKETIDKVSLETNIPARIIITPLIVEQLRLFYSEREIFKQVFAPLKILGNQNQFSLGVMGIKLETAKQIESNLEKDIHLLDFKTDDHDQERFERLTDENNRYYSYLYGALFIKELEEQWEKSGFPIQDRIDIIATLYNIGFEHSNPHENPLSGGAPIEIDGVLYSFGSLAKAFYESGELISVFPLKN
jgi:hypothetical protein